MGSKDKRMELIGPELPVADLIMMNPAELQLSDQMPVLCATSSLTLFLFQYDKRGMMVRSALAKMSWEGYTLRSLQHANPVFVPTFLYGTAWKKDRTGDLVHQAISTGLRAVDTAAQPKHYREDLVGEGVRKALSDGIVRRENLYVCDAEDLSNWGTKQAVRSKQNLPLLMDRIQMICRIIPRIA